MKIRAGRIGFRALAVLTSTVALGGCFSFGKESAIRFNVTPGPPRCSGLEDPADGAALYAYASGKTPLPNPPAKTEALWREFNDKLAALAHDVGTSDDDVPSVLEHIRRSVKRLAGDSGCRTIYHEAESYILDHYELHCDGMTGAREAERRALESAIQVRLSALQEVAKRYDRLCSAKNATMVLYNARAAAEGRPGPIEKRVAKRAGTTLDDSAAGCSTEHQEKCASGCAAGDLDACMVAATYIGKDPEKIAESNLKLCGLSLKKKVAPEKSVACLGLWSASMKADGAQMSSELVDQMCEIAPLSNICIMTALLEDNMFTRAPQASYSKERAIRVSEAIDACEGPNCPKYWLLMYPTKHYDVERARRAQTWMAAECAAHTSQCSATYLFNGSTPIFDKHIADETFAAIRGGCDGSIVFGDTKPRTLCNTLFAALTGDSGVYRNPSKALHMAKSACEAAEPDCYWLALCHTNGYCGTPKSPNKAHAAWQRECDFRLAKDPTATGIEACRRAKEEIAP